MPMSSCTFWRILLALPLLVTVPWALAQRQAPEPELKAAILVNMLLFVDWPRGGRQAPDRLTVCYFDAGPVAAALVQLDGKMIKGKPLQVVRVDGAYIGGCHALYMAPLAGATFPKIVTHDQASGVLVVGDSPGYLQRGAMLNLEIEDGRVVFDIDMRQVRQAGLAVSSKVLRLARRVLE